MVGGKRPFQAAQVLHGPMGVGAGKSTTTIHGRLAIGGFKFMPRMAGPCLFSLLPGVGLKVAVVDKWYCRKLLQLQGSL